ncbi:MAG: pyruvate, phosphate dikinase [Chloroflexi bacterium]|nr:pyruvate, phosphate dikinase [Chloroflexota bacterium]
MLSEFVFDFRITGTAGPEILGGKAFGLAKMTQMGINVPPGFVASTDACKLYYEQNGTLPDAFWRELDDHLDQLELQTGKRLGSTTDPLLVSVRSGAPVSMPGMMDTVLNVGLNDATVEALAQSSGNRHFAFDSYRRLLQMYGEVVLGLNRNLFEVAMSKVMTDTGSSNPSEIPIGAVENLVEIFKLLINNSSDKQFNQDPREQIRNCMIAVFESWNGKRARTYRRNEGISDDIGTAASVVAMVFGNLDQESGTGVCFTRNPSTGEPGLFGEFLQSAQGEDVVSGVRTPDPVSSMAQVLPAAYTHLLEHAETLERYNREMQDIEFTVERGKLFILQTRDGKRTVRAAVKIAVDLVQAGLISVDEALLRINPRDLSQLLLPQLSSNHNFDVVARGLTASPGAAAGYVALDADVAEQRAEAGDPVILVRPDTSPDDIHGFFASNGILTAKGGLTSHAAVVARGMGKPCVVGCSALEVDLDNRSFSFGGVTLKEGALITIDGTSGSVIIGEPELSPASTGAELEVLLKWADAKRRLKIMANADTPIDAVNARRFGAEGIGLCRTEHMFFGEDRLPKMQAMILAVDDERRAAALAELQPFQSQDFSEIFKQIDQNPVIIRLLDPPLHEFMPNRSDVDDPEVIKRIDELVEANPMLGMRGCRLGLMFPEIYRMQVSAIADAAIAVHEWNGRWPQVKIMLPMIGFPSEMERLRNDAETILQARNVPGVQIGMMLELPRACLVVDKFLNSADFFSFGTNDLTQTVLGFSRDDAESRFMGKYMDDGILANNPFESLDVAGVGQLIGIAVNSISRAGRDVSIGACGEHAGDPDSIKFFHDVGLNYVSCSPFRIPIARLAAAQAAIRARTTIKGTGVETNPVEAS